MGSTVSSPSTMVTAMLAEEWRPRGWGEVAELRVAVASEERFCRARGRKEVVQQETERGGCEKCFAPREVKKII
jgi:hypothetical protein